MPEDLSGEMLAASGHLGSPPGIFPPERLGPWQPVQEPMRTAPQSRVGPSVAAGGLAEWLILS